MRSEYKAKGLAASTISSSHSRSFIQSDLYPRSCSVVFLQLHSFLHIYLSSGQPRRYNLRSTSTFFILLCNNNQEPVSTHSLRLYNFKMQQKSFITAAFLASITSVSAFTNGSLVPSYICNPNADGLPKAFAQLLPYTRKNAQTIAVDGTAGDNKNIPQLQNGKDQGQPIGNSAYILASFHDSLNNLNSQPGNGIQVKTANGGPIVAGQANQLTLTTGNNNIQLLGVLAYANGADGTREGSFTDQAATQTFVQFPGCGTNKQGQTNGVIQQTGVSATVSFSPIQSLSMN
jgi:hypothetical protein